VPRLLVQICDLPYELGVLVAYLVEGLELGLKVFKRFLNALLAHVTLLLGVDFASVLQRGNQFDYFGLGVLNFDNHLFKFLSVRLYCLDNTEPRVGG
jgi:hypothetical protein